MNRKLKLMQGTLARNPSDSHKKSTKTNRAMETITIFNRRYIFIHGWCSIVMLIFRAFRGVRCMYVYVGFTPTKTQDAIVANKGFSFGFSDPKKCFTILVLTVTKSWTP